LALLACRLAERGAAFPRSVAIAAARLERSPPPSIPDNSIGQSQAEDNRPADDRHRPHRNSRVFHWHSSPSKATSCNHRTRYPFPAGAPGGAERRARHMRKPGARPVAHKRRCAVYSHLFSKDDSNAPSAINDALNALGTP
jgi:hypothetical protein